MIGGPPGTGTPAAMGLADSLLGTAVRSDQDAPAAGIHEEDRDLPFPRGHLGPVTNPSQMPRVPQSHQRQTELGALVQGDAHGLFADDLAEPEPAVEHGQNLVLADDLDRLVGDEWPCPHALDVPRNLDHPVRVMPHEVGLDQVVGDPLRLVMMASGGR